MPLTILLGTCLHLLGVNLAIDTYAQLPWCPEGLPEGVGCTTSIVGGPVEYAPGECYLPIPMEDSHYESFWCQPVEVDGANGPVNVVTPCLADVTSAANAPYAIRAYWAERECPQPFRSWGFCEVPNVCTPADKVAGACSCTPEDEPCAPGAGDAGVDGGELDGGTP